MIWNLEVLRALAALMVVLCHLGEISRTLGIPASAGSTGVDLFFVISGFVMAHTTRARRIGPWEFLRNRIARVVPAYWLMTLGVFLIAAAAPSLLRVATADPAQLIKSLLFIPFTKSDGLMEPILFVGWTLNLEMAFYLLYAAGLGFRRPVAGLMGVLAVLIVLTVAGFVWPRAPGAAGFYTTPRMLEFGIGILIALAVERAPKSAGPVTRLAMLGGLLFIPVLLVAPFVLPNALLITGALPAAIVVTSAVLLERWGWRWPEKTMIKVGAASYAMYLSHLYVTVPIRMAAKALHATGLVSWGLLALGLAAATLLALWLHKTAERPLVAWARRRLHVSAMTPQPAYGGRFKAAQRARSLLPPAPGGVRGLEASLRSTDNADGSNPL